MFRGGQCIKSTGLWEEGEGLQDLCIFLMPLGGQVKYVLSPFIFLSVARRTETQRCYLFFWTGE
jgi:hypothetical protein